MDTGQGEGEDNGKSMFIRSLFLVSSLKKQCAEHYTLLCYFYSPHLLYVNKNHLL